MFMGKQTGSSAANNRKISARSSQGKQKRAHKRYRLKSSIRRKLAILGVLAGLGIVLALLIWMWPVRESGFIILKARLGLVNGD